MRVFFIGSQEYAYEALAEMIDQKLEIVGVVTLEPAPHERWKKTVHELAVQENVPTYVFKDHLTLADVPDNINSAANVALIREAKPDVIFVIGWRQMIGKEIRAVPPAGVIGIHFSLLPKFRGHAPVSWSIVTNQKYAGLSLFYFDDGADTGDIILQKRTRIQLDDTVATLRARLTQLTRDAVRQVIPFLRAGRLPRVKQGTRGASISAYRLPEHGEIDWAKRTIDIYNEIRATTHPYPGAVTYYAGRRVRIWSAELLPRIPRYVGRPGQIIRSRRNRGVIVKTGDHALLVTRAEPEGSVEDDAAKFFRDTRKSFGYDAYSEIEALKTELAELRAQVEKLKGEQA